MRYAIISDVHANLEALTAVLDRIDGCTVDRTVCLGDVVGYNANPNECADIVRERGIPTVCGNHDAAVAGIEEPWGFNSVALSAVLWQRERLTGENHKWLRSLPDIQVTDDFIAVHGSPGDRDQYLFAWEDVLPYFDYLGQTDRRLCFFGHTHSPGIYCSDGIYTVDENSKFPIGDTKAFFINPGSVGQPRDGDARAAFGLLDTDKMEFELVRVEYAVEDAASKIVNSGLPPFLAERLFLGR